MEEKSNLVKAFINTETGEILYEKEPNSKVRESVSYLYVYDTIFLYLKKLSSRIDILVLLSLAFHLEFNSNRIELVLSKRKKIAEELGLNINHISRSITHLEKEGYIVRINRNEYELNMLAFWKGDVRERKRFVKAFDPFRHEKNVQYNKDKFFD